MNSIRTMWLSGTLTVLMLAACMSVEESAVPIEVQSHAYQVVRIPYPTTRPDGVEITRLLGDSAWTRAGLVVGDVVESVNGNPTLNKEDFWREVNGARPSAVRIDGGGRMPPRGPSPISPRSQAD